VQISSTSQLRSYALIAVLQLLYTKATAAEWLFPLRGPNERILLVGVEVKATLDGLKRATSIGEQL
jgi:hypothetical protein